MCETQRVFLDPQDVLGGVLIAILQDLLPLGLILSEHAGRGVVGLRFELVSAQLERVGDVLQEQEAEDEVLVLGGLDRAAQAVGSLESTM